MFDGNETNSNVQKKHSEDYIFYDFYDVRKWVRMRMYVER